MLWIDTGSKDVFYNFALEYYLATEKQFAEPVFLIWQTTPTLMVGRYQNVFEEINLLYVMGKHNTVVRRMSGGGTIYTDEQVFQYSFIAPRSGSEIEFLFYTKPIINALNQMGIPAEFNNRNDLMIGGRKVSGTAQYNAKGYTVHHGSVLYDVDVEELEHCLHVDAEKIISKGIKSVRERVVNLKNYIPGKKDVTQFMGELKGYVLGTEIKEYQLTEGEKCRIAEIADAKFRGWDWNFGNSPKCDLVKSRRLDGGKVEFHLSIENGEIRDCVITGDFFSGKDLSALSKTLCGCRLDRKDLQERLEGVDVTSFFYHISNDAILDILAG